MSDAYRSFLGEDTLEAVRVDESGNIHISGADGSRVSLYFHRYGDTGLPTYRPSKRPNKENKLILKRLRKALDKAEHKLFNDGAHDCE